jgi:hypothetical protein
VRSNRSWAHARRKFFDIGRINKAPIASLSGQNETAKAIAYSFTRWVALFRFVDDGRLGRR